MTDFKKIISRVRWRNTILFFVFFFIALAAFYYILSNPTHTEGDISLKCRADPSGIKMDERADIIAEVENKGGSWMMVKVSAKTYDSNMIFESTPEADYDYISTDMTRIEKSSIQLGPHEKKVLKFTANLKENSLEGRYRIDTEVGGGNSTVYCTVYINAKN